MRGICLHDIQVCSIWYAGITALFPKYPSNSVFSLVKVRMGKRMERGSLAPRTIHKQLHSLSGKKETQVGPITLAQLARTGLSAWANKTKQ